MSKLKKVAEQITDGWMNLLAAIGVQGKDKRVSHLATWIPMSQQDCDNFYSADDSAQKVVDEIVDDGTREWITIKQMDEQLKTKVMARHDRLMVREKFAEAWRLSRLHGGSVIIPLFMGDSNILKLAEPLPENPGELKGLLVLNRWEIQNDTLDEDIMSSNFGYPKTYTISPQSTAQNQGLAAAKIHYTRVLRFEGAYLPRRMFVTNNYWHDSVLNRAKDAIRDYNFAFDSGNAALGDFSVSKFKIKNLAELIAAGKEAEIKQRLEIVSISKSLINAVCIDADGEDWQEVSRSLAGVPDVMAKSSQRMVAASKLPHTRMLGESPSGLGATGRTEERNYYDYVAFRQELDLAKNVDKVLKFIINDVGGGQATDWSWEFKSLWQLTELEQADRYQKNAQGDQVYLQNQVLDASEIATSRFGGDEYSDDIKLTLGRDEAPVINSETYPNAVVPGAQNAKGQDIQRQALNSAQVSSLIGLIGQFYIGNLPRATALGIMTTAFPMSKEEAEAILGAEGNGFKPASPELLVAGKSGSNSNIDAEDEQEATHVQSIILSKSRFGSEAEARQWASRNGYKNQKVDETEDSFRLRQVEPEEFDADSFRTIEMTTGVKAVIGKKK